MHWSLITVLSINLFLYSRRKDLQYLYNATQVPHCFHIIIMRWIPYSANFWQGKLWWIWQNEYRSPIFYPAKFQVHYNSYCIFANIFLTKTLKQFIRRSFTPPKFFTIRYHRGHSFSLYYTLPALRLWMLSESQLFQLTLEERAPYPPVVKTSWATQSIRLEAAIYRTEYICFSILSACRFLTWQMDMFLSLFPWWNQLRSLMKMVIDFTVQNLYAKVLWTDILYCT